MLKAVVQDGYVSALPRRLCNPPDLRLLGHHRYAGIPSLVEQDFVHAITPRDERGSVSHRDEASEEPRRNGCFSGSADRKIPDRNDGNTALGL